MCLWRFNHKDRTKQVLMTTDTHCEPITQTTCWGGWGHIWPHTLIHPDVAQEGKYIIIIWMWCFGFLLLVKAKMNWSLQISTVGIDHACFSSWNIIVSLASPCVGVGDLAKITSVHYIIIPLTGLNAVLHIVDLLTTSKNCHWNSGREYNSAPVEWGV